ncbi:hypothetical protein TYRP_003160 [Tyrophagus putrescentiae]|nr:hypothetical protein TYRP_003160 [Tyrophagus putrescentiae]
MGVLLVAQLDQAIDRVHLAEIDHLPGRQFTLRSTQQQHVAGLHCCKGGKDVTGAGKSLVLHVADHTLIAVVKGERKVRLTYVGNIEKSAVWVVVTGAVFHLFPCGAQFVKTPAVLDDEILGRPPDQQHQLCPRTTVARVVQLFQYHLSGTTTINCITGVLLVAQLDQAIDRVLDAEVDHLPGRQLTLRHSTQQQHVAGLQRPNGGKGVASVGVVLHLHVADHTLIAVVKGRRKVRLTDVGNIEKLIVLVVDVTGAVFHLLPCCAQFSHILSREGFLKKRIESQQSVPQLFFMMRYLGVQPTASIRWFCPSAILYPTMTGPYFEEDLLQGGQRRLFRFIFHRRLFNNLHHLSHLL